MAKHILSFLILVIGNEGDFENRMPLIDCKGFPEELQQEGVKIVCDVAIKRYPNPGAIRLAAKEIELKEYKIISTSER